MAYVLDGKDGRLTRDEFEALAAAGNIIVWAGGKRAELLKMFFTIIGDEIALGEMDEQALLDEIREALQERIDGKPGPLGR